MNGSSPSSDASIPQLGQRISGTTDIAAYLSRLNAGHPAEFVHAFFLDKDMYLCWSETVARGGREGALLDFRELISLALRVNSFSLILAHNHPSGFARPSPADVTTTLELVRLCEKIGIRLLDHIIVAGSNCFSFRAERYL